jgi:hypothetical protein
VTGAAGDAAESERRRGSLRYVSRDETIMNKDDRKDAPFHPLYVVLNKGRDTNRRRMKDDKASMKDAGWNIDLLRARTREYFAGTKAGTAKKSLVMKSREYVRGPLVGTVFTFGS